MFQPGEVGVARWWDAVFPTDILLELIGTPITHVEGWIGHHKIGFQCGVAVVEEGVGMVLANGSLSSQSGGEGEIRKNILQADLVEGIVALPSQLFYSTGIPVCLWFLSRQKSQPGNVVFIDARNMGTMVTRKLRELTEDDINRIAQTFTDYRNGTLQDEKGYCAVKTLEEIGAQDFILTPGRYVGIAEQEEDGEPFEEKMQRLTTELSGLFAESHRLEEEIRKQLGNIGFNID